MNNRILEQLEFDKVKQLFAGYLQTEQGQEELRQLSPMTESDRISRSFDEMSDMEQIFIEQHGFGLGSLRDISESMRRLELDADVNVSEIIDIKKILQVSAEVKHFYNDLENVNLT
ncbi:MAG: endonuclease MutS2, partial [Streptococcus lutetiensis]|nr:endonuclease MutS2 [Streptococcus lutetiensis]